MVVALLTVGSMLTGSFEESERDFALLVVMIMMSAMECVIDHNLNAIVHFENL
jgi:hypothetical protein